jgi:hypothetical protein
MLERTSSKRRLALILTIIGLFCFNNWTLGFVIKGTAGIGKTISELSIPAAPHSWIFRGLDIIAGLLLLVVSWQWPQHVGNPWAKRLLRIGLLAITVGTIVDAALPIHCIINGDGECVGRRTLDLLDALHLFESTFIAVLIFLAPIGVLLDTKELGRIKFVRQASYALVGIMVIWGIETFILGLLDAGGEGYMQRVFMVFVSVWLLFCSAAVYHFTPTRPPLQPNP